MTASFDDPPEYEPSDEDMANLMKWVYESLGMEEDNGADTGGTSEPQGPPSGETPGTDPDYRDY